MKQTSHCYSSLENRKRVATCGGDTLNEKIEFAKTLREMGALICKAFWPPSSEYPLFHRWPDFSSSLFTNDVAGTMLAKRNLSYRVVSKEEFLLLIRRKLNKKLKFKRS